ncbi:MAG: hypothetical protein FJZ47_21725 [Candidatus Tectomicrobia bacterium]|uniref:Uncharacterized protein n=1 Tax=Tectimicrobiota bacterium TaxID=2528274 RepID=A0A938B2Q4_UNCTE|nr:hypothetical protein [Candidatus Tectomicrobia bacterium]
MTLASLSHEEAQQWLDRTRACGLGTRFTLPRVAEPLSQLDWHPFSPHIYHHMAHHTEAFVYTDWETLQRPEGTWP